MRNHDALIPLESTASHRVAHRGGILVTVLVTLLLVGTITLSVLSTLVALRTAKERDEAKDDFIHASAAVDRLTESALGSAKLKSAEPARQELLRPSLDYYEKFIAAHAKDPQPSPELASAQFHAAALYAKAGSANSVDAMAAGLNILKKLKDTNTDPASYPSLQNSALRLVPPTEWAQLKEGTSEQRQAHGGKLFITVQMAGSTFEDLSKKYPQSIGFRDDLAAIRNIVALFMNFQRRPDQEMRSRMMTRDVLETLVRNAPDNADFKTRLAETLTTLANLQKAANENDQAIASFDRAIQMREQLAAAEPSNQSLAQNVTIARRQLDRLKAAPAAKPAPPKEAPAPEAASAEAAPPAAPGQ